MQQIETFVGEIDAKVEAITTASSREQAVGLSEISDAVNSIDQMTQKNASMVEETTLISNSLAADSNLLSSMVGRFQLNQSRDDKGPMTRQSKRSSPAQGPFAAPCFLSASVIDEAEKKGPLPDGRVRI